MSKNKCLKFQFIQDSRFNGSKSKLISMDKQLKKFVKIVGEGSIRTIHFPKSNEEEETISWRKEYIVEKIGTWDETMSKINKIQAPFYKKVKC